MPRLELNLLGGFHARLKGGTTIEIRARKTRALLAYLAFPPGRHHTRETLVALLWSDRGEKQAHASLRQALVDLSRALETIQGTPLLKERQTIALNREAVEVDVVLFEQLAARDDIVDLERAATIYAGDLLEGLEVRDSAFEDWLLVERRRLQNRALAVLKRLLELQTGPVAIATAERLVSLDPLQEEGHRTLMRLHAKAGELGLALRQYEICRDVLRRELDVAPSVATETLHREIRSGEDGKGPGVAFIATTQSQSSNGRLSSRSELEAAELRPGQEFPQLPSKPSIAVLPFTRMSSDAEHEFFAEGLTDDLITDLSRAAGLFVIARNSSFAYRNKSIDVRVIARELGVRYIVEGSARRAAGRVRINVQLIDAFGGGNLWAGFRNSMTGKRRANFARPEEIAQKLCRSWLRFFAIWVKPAAGFANWRILTLTGF